MARRAQRGIVLAGALSLLAPGLAAADLTGTWIGTIAKRGRTPARNVAIRLEQDGASLGGKVYNERGSSDAIVTGRIEGGDIAFDVEAIEQAGNQINLVVYRFEGTLDGGEMEVTRERASARNAATGTSVPVRREWDSDEEDRARRFRTFRLKRLY